MSSEPGQPSPTEPGEPELLAWARAVVLGLRDTAEDVLAEGRKGANEAYGRYWERYQAKAKRRRSPR